MKYEKEYLETRTKEEFISVMFKKYLHLKKSSIERYYRFLKNIHGEQIIRYPSEEKMIPSLIKQLEFKDMKRYKYKITRTLLKKYNWNDYEINWLEDERLFSE